MLSLTLLQRGVNSLDRYCYSLFSSLRSRYLFATTARWVSGSGDGYWYLFVAYLLVWVSGSNWDYLIALAITFAIERPLYWLLKNSFRRNRPTNYTPDALLIAHDKFSFPSGHTCAAFVFATVTSSFFPALAAPLLIWAAMIGVSRVVVGVHYPTDIMAGMCLGLLISEWTLTFVS